MKRKDINNYIKIKMDILWQGNPLSTVKTFGRRCCKLCARERLEILKFEAKNPGFGINKHDEVHGTCHHNPKFHRFEPMMTTASTDESSKDERVNRPDSTKSATSTSSPLSSNDESIFENRELELIQLPGVIGGVLKGEPTNPTYDETREEGFLARFKLGQENDSSTDEVSEGEEDPPIEELPIIEDHAED